ncbi:MAG TPA: AsmA family protein [Vicinamibacterales bacterium]|nr:AsmA family protein [Vicinamibacterales bacterium]
MIRKIALGLFALVVVLGVAGTIAVRSLMDPENIRQTLEHQASARLGQSVRVGRVDLAFWPRAGVTVTDLAIGEPATLTLARTEVSTAMRSLLSRRIEDADVVVEGGDIDLPRLLAALDQLTAAPAATPSPSGNAPAGDAAVTLVNIRTLALRNVRVTSGTRTAVFNLQSSLEGDRLTIDRVAVASEVTSLEGQGVIDSVSKKRARLSLTADSLDLDGLIAFAQDFAASAAGASASPSEPVSAPAVPGDLDVVLELKAAKGRAAGVAFEHLSATARVTPTGLAFEPFALGIFGGRLEGTVRVDLSGPEPALAIAGTMAGVDMTRVTEFAGQSGSITGTLSGSVSVSGSGADPERALAGARGQGTLAIKDGTMKGLQLVRPIVLAFGKPDAAQPLSGGEAFSQMAASYTLTGGVVTLTDLSFDSRDVELRGGGTLTLNGSMLDVKADAKLSPELTAQAGRDLVRYSAENGQVTLPATVTGTLEDPKVGINVGSVARRAMTNELKRQTESVIKGLLGRPKKPK